MTRKLATIRKVINTTNIEGADKIELITVDSWNVVYTKGAVSIGSLVVYFEIDSWIPTSLVSISKKQKLYNGISGNVLKTVRIRGQLSQGLILTIQDIQNAYPDFATDISLTEGEDITEYLKIMKWEPPSSLVCEPKGNFPSYINKTDQDRIQNLTKYFDEYKEHTWEVTEKLDGTSLTVYVYNDIYGVCSRNFDLKRENDNVYWKMAIKEQLLEKIKKSGRNLAIQGEIIGTKIGKNIYGMSDFKFYLFDIFDIEKGVYFLPNERQEFADMYDIPHVFVIYKNYTIHDTIDSLLTLACGTSMLSEDVEREGLVFKSHNSNISFKVISNTFLTK